MPSSRRVVILSLWLALTCACSEEAAQETDAAATADRAQSSHDADGAQSSRDALASVDRSLGARDGASDVRPTEAGTTSCTIFPADNPWNTDISGYAVHSNSANFIASIGASKGLHPDFGTVWEGAPIGIPYVVVTANQARVPITFVDWPGESDPGPYPIPLDAPIEGGASSTGDRHVLALDLTGCMLYELYNAWPEATRWRASNGAKWDLRSNTLRPLRWTSADAAGLPIYPGLVRYDEVKAGAIKHALRFTVARTQRAYVLPATHYASESTDPNRPPMGLRLRLKASFKLSDFARDVQVILSAMQRYGLIVADNGSDWYISGAPDARWNDEELAQLARVKGSDFEVVDTGRIMTY